MNIKIQPFVIQKFVVVESVDGVFLWGDPQVEFHKEIVQKMRDSGISIINVRGGAKIKMEEGSIYVWGKSSVYGEIIFEDVRHILKEKFPEYQILNKDPQGEKSLM